MAGDVRTDDLLSGSPALPVPRAVVLDVDGTLYRQRPLRRRMALTLVFSHVLRPFAGWRTIRALQAFRHAHEELRARGDAVEDPGPEQLALAAAASGLPGEEIAAAVSHWMEQAPLAHLAPLRFPGLVEFLRHVRGRGVRIGVFSDYPPEAKLRALGVNGLVDAALWASHPEVRALKPQPAGILAVLERLQVAPPEAVYVGDRPDVDVPAARAAGCVPAIVGPKALVRSADGWLPVGTFARLQDLLFPAE